MSLRAVPPHPARRAVIVGSGISGLAAALTLHRAGWQTLIVERAPERRTGGYWVRFSGPGYAAADRLGILDALPKRAASGARLFEMGPSGRIRPGFPIPESAEGTPLRILLRSDLERVLYDAVSDLVEIRYGVGPAAISQDRHEVTVMMTDGSVERADLLIGADGIHSTVRSLVYGPEDLYRKDFDHAVAACIFDRELPGVSGGDALIATAPGRSAWINTYVGHPPVAFLLYRTPWPAAEVRRDPAEALREAFSGFGGTVMPTMLDAMERSESVVFDQVSQIHINRWSQGRVVLLGDAAWCMSLYSGQGAGMGIAGAEALSRALDEHGQVSAALGAWERELRPVIARFQKQAHVMQHLFMPVNRVGYVARRTAMRVVSIPAVSKIAALTMR
ncbi:FAD-dependent monooxygenase [Streptomyces justiciae]|uniref:FAD-dependent monooxygenase n=1 Tax=Streptomyces justiciae TaxID=2780140 RepID=UPI0021199224|nr:FAD-dependent monooxygenase [Streptomyces justiciae]MCW8378678.1 FAD-dependent monooxygenase [Streptomyces justiciae]